MYTLEVPQQTERLSEAGSHSKLLTECCCCKTATNFIVSTCHTQTAQGILSFLLAKYLPVELQRCAPKQTKTLSSFQRWACGCHNEQYSARSIEAAATSRTHSELGIRLVHRGLIARNAYWQAGDNILCRSCFSIHTRNTFL